MRYGDINMNALSKTFILSASGLALTAATASAAIVCNVEGDCWHARGNPSYGPELRLTIHPDTWKWGGHEKYRWHEHKGHGYWRGGSWVELK
jgi:hypothetical protein